MGAKIAKILSGDPTDGLADHTMHNPHTNEASREICAFNTLLTGQLAFAPAAYSWNFSGVTPGIFAFNTRSEWVMPTPGSRVIVQVTSRESAVRPASCNTKLSAMAKQPECAAAISSSGLVPTPCSNRDL